MPRVEAWLVLLPLHDSFWAQLSNAPVAAPPTTERLETGVIPRAESIIYIQTHPAEQGVYIPSYSETARDFRPGRGLRVKQLFS